MFPARSPLIRHRNELTERDWENAVQGLGNCLAMLVIFSVVSFKHYCPVLFTVLLEIIIDIDSFKIHTRWFTYNTNLKVCNTQYCYKLLKKNYYVAFNLTLCYFLTYLLEWYLLNISRTCTSVSLCHTCRLRHTHSFLANFVQLWFPCGQFHFDLAYSMKSANVRRRPFFRWS